MSKVYTLFSQSSRHPKIVKNGIVRDVYTLIMHLAPADRSGYEVCPMRSVGCTAACLNTAGYHYAKKEQARINRTKMFFEDREAFMQKMYREIKNGNKYAYKHGYLFGVRLNGTSDIPWEQYKFRSHDTGLLLNIMEHFYDVPFYDYTKRHNRKNLPRNYRLTFSRSEDNQEKIGLALLAGMNVAVVFDTHKTGYLPKEYLGLPVIDGDEHDFRYDDPDCVIVGLRAKGKARHDETGFVVKVGK